MSWRHCTLIADARLSPKLWGTWIQPEFHKPEKSYKCQHTEKLPSVSLPHKLRISYKFLLSSFTNPRPISEVVRTSSKQSASIQFWMQLIRIHIVLELDESSQADYGAARLGSKTWQSWCPSLATVCRLLELWSKYSCSLSYVFVRHSIANDMLLGDW